MKKANKFTRVDLEKELCADTDGCPVFRKCHDHEIFLAFYDDSGAYAFQEWWDDIGAEQMLEWMKTNEEYVYDAEHQDD